MATYTSSDVYDKLVLSYVWIRIIFLAFIPLFAVPQFIYLCKRLKRRRMRVVGTERYVSSLKYGPKFITYLTLIIFPLFRIADQVCLLYAIPRSGVGSKAWIFAVVSTYFLVIGWIFIGCYWVQVIYTFFISTSIILKNSKRAWVTSWIFAAVFGAWMLFILIYGIIRQSAATSLYAYGFFSFLIILGIIIVVHGLILVRFLKKQENHSIEYENTINKTLKLSITLLVFILVIIFRDIIWMALGLSRTSDYRYITYLIVGICEIVQAVIVMTALSNSQLWKVFTFQETDNSMRSSNVVEDAGSVMDQPRIANHVYHIKGLSTSVEEATRAETGVEFDTFMTREEESSSGLTDTAPLDNASTPSTAHQDSTQQIIL
ncbi:hypothetical protein DFA_05223 [Cavenderia fasciculata]|uniref:THH1/TOM1/TOM3 domain-containing protein n=1 Tax=Cavenderia fasciculata TaxID=261658 RepID=F4PNP0_CACFS|nr:uncharacterized protein DFA_05223 [Cavenderia fasciculata]EGG23093.1 hypothetical protein DFA_05223 [Cavenderia fasciculata]|eukprot:XP_004360944.1 hypothetical protein DFA_05223 [Cavenderia fasciculata]